MVARRIAGGLGTGILLAALVFQGGCGLCTDDDATEVGLQRQAAAQVGVLVPPIEVPRQDAGPFAVDVLFLLDDSAFMTEDTVAIGENEPIGAIPGDGRIKTDVAQELFADARQKLLAQLVADGRGTAADFDLAFGVARFEDYANQARTSVEPEDGSPADPVDGLARPFVLNQPILQEDHPLFNTLFSAALSRETPGDGGQDPQDAQSALEALFQAATGDGFDGNGDAQTTGSGAAGLLATQTNPGTSGDVPAFLATPVASLPDGSPVYQVGDTLASGNLGGVGWRPDSIRLVVMVTDIVTVTPLLTGSDPDGPISNTPSPTGTGPRQATTITSVQAFAPFTGTVAEQAAGRFGPQGTAGVAPANAATLQATVDALNEMDIEVLSIGLPRSIRGGPTKPNVPGPALPGEVPAVVDPQVPPSDEEAFTFESALALLTGARDTDATDSDPRFVTGLPLVYNMTTISPAGGPITGDLVEDLSDRVGTWIPFKQGNAITDAGSAFYTFTFALTNPNAALTLTPDPGFAIVPDVDPGGANPIYVSQSGATQVVRIPRYVAGTPAPASVRVAFQIAVERTDPNSLGQILAAMPFSITAAATPAGQVPGGKNPTLPPNTLPSLGSTSGTLAVVFPEIPADIASPDDVPVNTCTLATLSQGEALYRDIGRDTPTGTSIATMAGPLGNEDLPYPPVAP